MLRRIVAVGFVLILLLPLTEQLTGMFGADTAGLRERRRLNALPSLRSEAPLELPKEFDRYYQDNFGMRSLFIRTANSIRYHLLQVSPHPRVLVGRDGWLFHGEQWHREFFQGRSRFSDRELAHLRRVFRARAEFLEALGIHYLIVVVPSKGSVYPEYYSPRFPRVSPHTRFDQFLAEVAEPLDLPVLDLRPNLRAAKESSPYPLYIRTDSHWNDLGAYHGYLGVIEALQEYYPDLKPLPREMFRRQLRTRAGGFGSMLGVFGTPESNVHVLVPLRQDKALSRARSARQQRIEETGSAKHPLHIVRSANSEQVQIPSAIVYRDSFFSRMLKFFSQHVAISSYYPTSQFTFDPRLIWRKRPALVIDQVTDHGLMPEGQPGWPVLYQARLLRRFERLQDEREVVKVAWKQAPKRRHGDASRSCVLSLSPDRPEASAVLKVNDSEEPRLVRIKLRSSSEGRVKVLLQGDTGEDWSYVYPVAPTKNVYVIEVPGTVAEARLKVQLDGVEQAQLSRIALL